MSCTTQQITMKNLVVPITHVDSSGNSDFGVLTHLSLQGMEFDAHSIPGGRFAWLDFHLPENGYRVKALGEIRSVHCEENRFHISIDFKHLFPSDRAAMSNYLEASMIAA